MRSIFMFLLASLSTLAAAQSMAPGIAEWRAGDGSNVPSDWKVESAMLFRHDARGGHKVLGVRGQGEDTAFWLSPAVVLKPGGAYLFRFRAQGEGGGLIISGLSQLNHDFNVPSDWKTFSFAFRTPDMGGEHYLRMGQWNIKGEVYFDRPEMFPVQVMHSRWGSLSLGEGEELRKGQYTDTHTLGWQGTTIHRTLFRHNTYFNTNRWTFGGAGGDIVYRHTLPYRMRSAKIDINVNLHTGGKLAISASKDGRNWILVAEAEKVGQVENLLPAGLFPSRQIFVRLQAEGENAGVQVDRYIFRADVEYQGATRVGRSTLIEEQFTTPCLQAVWEPAPEGWRVKWSNRQERLQTIRMSLGIDGKWRSIGTVILPERKEVPALVKMPPLASGTHQVSLRATDERAMLYSAQTEVKLTVIGEQNYGYPLETGNASLGAWWCEGAWKVGRDRTLPSGKPASAVRIEAARGEYEPAQIVLYSMQEGTTLLEARVGNLTGKQGRIPASRITLREVATVRVEHPSDYLGEPGEYPDPLPLLKTPLPLPAKRNQAIWVLVSVPEKVPAGKYRSTIRFKTNRGEISFPLEVEVYDFTLPKETHLRSGFGFYGGRSLRQYHHLKTSEQEQKVFEMYLKSFSEHRISPYSFYDYGPIRMNFEGEGSEKWVKVEFTDFDREAERYLDKLGFNSFSLPVQGLGGGTFYDRVEGEFGGFKAGTPDYEQLMADYLGQLESHLKAKGWLDKAYVYWFDEPDPKDYPFVVEVMKRIRKYAPGIRRLLTEQPEKELLGHVEIWCGLTPEWTIQTVAERRKAGEEVWWYICTGPRAPYIGLFVEHPAVVMRLWPWQSWQYGVQGILIWATNWWTSDVAFPDSLQNPWEDPMSYVSGYGTPRGTKAFWGNGDGRFFYPPRRDPNKPHTPILEPPIPALRWENLRDGVEDYEYFWLLDQQIKRLKGKVDTSLLNQAQSLLKVPAAISKDLTGFTSDPRPLLDHRRKIARMIERLPKIR